MVLIIDNYDSFSYNLYQAIGVFTPDIKVIKNDELTVSAIDALKPTHIILSPGPSRPENAGVCLDVIKYLHTKYPILGVCLGHQSICQAFGATITYAKEVLHGKQSYITYTNSCLFRNLKDRNLEAPSQMIVGRYHSLAAALDTMPQELEITATTEDGEIMAVQHKDYPIYGVQFHPESILTPEGDTIIKNFLETKPMNPIAQKGGSQMIKDAISTLGKKENLSPAIAEIVMDEIMSGQISPVLISSYLTALAIKGETIDEIVASAKSMRKHATKLLNDQEVLEIVGTGGDKSNSFNISTTSAIVLASAGVPIAKHGNRAASSKCGSADVLEALGVKIDVSPEKSMELLDRIHICFLFAPLYHNAMKHVAPVRKELGMRTIFNILGPLSNPLGASMQLMGVYEEGLVEPLAEVLTALGVKKGMVVYGTDGLDEISISAPTKVCEIRNGWFKSYDINPLDYGFGPYDKSELVGGTALENAEITRAVLNGEKGAKRDAVVLNAAAALYITRDNLSLKDAIQEIQYIIDSGKATQKLEEFIQASQS